MSTIESALEHAIEGQARVVGVVADAGVGKRRLCFEFVERCRGRGVAVYEASIIAWQKRLAMSEGIFGEATSAVAFAGLERLIADGVIAADDRVVVPVTGSGLKEPLPE